jgi:hypothetical protein
VTCCVGAYENRVVRGIGVASAANASGVAVVGRPPGMGEGRAQPICRGMAGGACAGQKWSACDLACGNVIGYGSAERRCAIPIRSVATVTVGGRNSGTRVAEIAGHRDVGASQREAGRAVVKGCAQPRGRRVARRASGGIA